MRGDYVSLTQYWRCADALPNDSVSSGKAVSAHCQGAFIEGTEIVVISCYGGSLLHAQVSCLQGDNHQSGREYPVITPVAEVLSCIVQSNAADISCSSQFMRSESQRFVIGSILARMRLASAPWLRLTGQEEINQLHLTFESLHLSPKTTAYRSHPEVQPVSIVPRERYSRSQWLSNQAKQISVSVTTHRPSTNFIRKYMMTRTAKSIYGEWT